MNLGNRNEGPPGLCLQPLCGVNGRWVSTGGTPVRGMDRGRHYGNLPPQIPALTDSCQTRRGQLTYVQAPTTHSEGLCVLSERRGRSWSTNHELYRVLKSLPHLSPPSQCVHCDTGGGQQRTEGPPNNHPHVTSSQ